MTHSMEEDILLTAYALGEVDDAADLSRIERLIAGDASASRMVAEVRACGLLLADGLKGEPDVGLTAIQYAGIERRLAADAAVDAPRAGAMAFRRNWGLWGSIAASTLIVATVMAAVVPQFLGKQSATGPGGGKGSGAAGDRTALGDGAGGAAATDRTLLFPGKPVDSSGAAGAGDLVDWPMLRTSAGGLPWPAVTAADTGLREPAFVVAGDFPLAVIPPAPSFPDAAGRGTLAAAKATVDAGRLPSPQSVRTDELINSVHNESAAPLDQGPVAASIESAVCPWNSGHTLVRVVVRTTGHPEPASEPVAEAAIAPLVRDLRLAVEVNPAAAAGYRIIGYENPPRSWGEWAGRDEREIVGAGKTFTALLEVVPTGQTLPSPSTQPSALRYRRPDSVVVTSTELLTVGVEYRQGPTAEAKRIDLPISVDVSAIELASPDFRTAAAAGALGMALRHADPAAEASLDVAVKLLSDVTATAPTDDRQMLLDIARRVQAMKRP